MEQNLILPEGYASSEGLPRVCCVAHPEDRMHYQDEVAKDFHNIRHCAVYFASTGEKELDLILKQVQLAAFLVTSRFLDDPAGKNAFALALEKHVPILPLQKEAGVEARFNKICDSYQLLWKENPDPTVIDYTKKLRDLLEKVFLDKKTAEDLLGAFQERYIFLSYRKKNRALAQELMKRIHDLEGREDIRIWYDEFLVAGDRWDTAIEERLKGSAMMVLAVTPDVVNEPNFVTSEEIPQARDRKPEPVPILPVVMAPTPEDTLEAKGLTGWVDPQDDRAINSRLKRSFGKGKAGHDEQDRYRLGMAYLNGCHVEVCRERGVKMLREAADHGYLDAIRALADMYATGNGVALDYKESIRLRERAVNQLRKSPKERGKYLRDLQLLGLDCYSAGAFELARKYLQQAVEELEKLSNSPSFVVRINEGVARKWLAYVLMQKPDPEFLEAEKHLERAEELERREMAAAKGVDQKQYAAAGRELIDTLNKRILLYRRQMRSATEEGEKRTLLEKAARSIRQADPLCGEFPGSASNDAQMWYAKFLFECGQKEEGVTRAEDILRRVLQQLEEQNDPRQQTLRRMGAVMHYVNVIELLLGVGKFDRAEEYIRQAEELNKPFCQSGETQAKKYADNLAKLQNRLDAAQQ